MCVAPRAGRRALLAAHPSMKVLSARYSFSAARSTPIVAGLFGVWGLRRNLDTTGEVDGRATGRRTTGGAGLRLTGVAPWTWMELWQM